MEEIWKDIEGYEGLYQVSNLGRVKSLCEWSGNKFKSQYKKREKILNLSPKKNGYLIATLRYKNKIKYKAVHRLVAEAFIPNINNEPIVNHKDGNKTNNKINNLEWCTYKHNSQEAIRLGIWIPNYNGPQKGKFGKEHNCSKEVYQIDKNTNEIISMFHGVKEASRETGISCCSIYSVVSNRRKTAGGYKWRYVNGNN